MSYTSRFSKKQKIIKEMQDCMTLVHQFSQRLKQNRQKVSEIKSLKVETSVDFSSRNDSGDSIMKCNNSLLSLYRLNFPIKEEDSLFLLKELCVRLSAKKLALGAVIDIFGELYESQLVAIMSRKLSYDNSYRLRKTVRYMFQITPFDCERTRDRIQLIDTVEQKLQEHGLLQAVKQQQQTARKVFTKQQQIELVKSLTTQGVRYDSYPFNECVPILEKIIGDQLAFQLLVNHVEDKRSIAMMNPFEVLGVPGTLVPSYFKKESCVTNVTMMSNESFWGSMEDQINFEDCEIECVPYQSVFGGAIGAQLYKIQ